MVLLKEIRLNMWWAAQTIKFEYFSVFTKKRGIKIVLIYITYVELYDNKLQKYLELTAIFLSHPQVILKSWSDQIWSILIQPDPIWSNLIQSVPIWSNLIQFDPSWSNLIQYDPKIQQSSL